MEIEQLICDRCRREVKHLTPVKSKPIGLDRELCTECIEDMKAWLWNKPSPHTKTLYEISETELQAVYRRGAEALEAWANGATADEMAEHIREMLVQAKQEAQETPRTILGVAI